jgi:hypothetical protein
MLFARRTLVLFILPALPLLAVGCGGGSKGGDPEMMRRTSELGEIHEIYMMYAKRHQRPPKHLADLNQKEFQGIYPVGLQALRSGRYVAVWGVSGKDPGAVVAYEKDGPTKGGSAVMADGTVRTLTGEELKAALKSKT